MPSHCCDYWLLDIVVIQKLPNLIGALVPIHKRHIAVHEDKNIRCKLILIGSRVLNDHFKSFLAVVGPITNILAVVDLDDVLQNDHNCIDIEGLVVNNKDPFIIF